MSDEQVGRFVINKDTDFKTKKEEAIKRGFENLENNLRKSFRHLLENKALPDKIYKSFSNFLFFVGVNING